MNIDVRWGGRALDYFWRPIYNGTQQEKTRQENIVRNFASTRVVNAASAEIRFPGHVARDPDPHEPWYITTIYFDAYGAMIKSPYGGAWHVYA